MSKSGRSPTVNPGPGIMTVQKCRYQLDPLGPSIFFAMNPKILNSALGIRTLSIVRANDVYFVDDGV